MAEIESATDCAPLHGYGPARSQPGYVAVVDEPCKPEDHIKDSKLYGTVIAAAWPQITVCACRNLVDLTDVAVLGWLGDLNSTSALASSHEY